MKRRGVFGTPDWQVIRDGVLDHLEEFLSAAALLAGRSNAELVQELDHEAAETIERARYTRLRVDLDERVLLRVHVDLKERGSVERRVEEHQ